MMFVAVWTFVVGWLCATIYYQFSLLGQSPSALYWLTGIGLLVILVFIIMRKLGSLPCFNQHQLPTAKSHKQSACCE